MLALTISMVQDIRALTTFSKRGFNAIMKKVLMGTATMWHTRYAKKHFQRPAFSWYAEFSAIHAKKKGQPLVVTGTLRGRILRARKPDTREMSATSTRATLRFPFGRPPVFSEEESQKKIAMLMKYQRKTKKQAECEVYRVGYSDKAKRTFQSLIIAVAPNEIREMKKYIKDEAVRESNARGGKRTRKL